MKHLILVLCILVSVHQAAAQTITNTTATDSLTWTVEQVPTGDLLDGMLNFISPDTGWVTAHNIHTTEKTIYQTFDGGVHWQLFPSQTRKPFFIQDSHTYFAYEHDSMFKSTDAGATWFGDTILIQGGPLQITPIGLDTIYALGDGEFGSSFDGGRSWLRRGIANVTIDMAWADSKHGIVVGDGVTTFPGPNPTIAYPSGIIYLTADAGRTFTPQCDSIYQALETAWYCNPKKAMVAGNHGACSITKDGGLTWENLSLKNGKDILGLWFVDSLQGYAIGEAGMLLRTMDCGENWSIQSSGTNQNLFSIHFCNDSIGYIGGDSGVLLRTQNGGASWVLSSPTRPFGVQLFPNPAINSVAINYTLAEQSVVAIEISNTLGQTVLTQNLSLQTQGAHSQSLDLSGLAAGAYYYALSAGGQSEAGSFSIFR